MNIAKHLSHVCLVVHDDLETAVSEVAAEGEDLAGEAVVDGVQAPADNIYNISAISRQLIKLSTKCRGI